MNDQSKPSSKRSRPRLAIASMALSAFLVTLTGSWAEARWPNAAPQGGTPAAAWITLTPDRPVDTVDTLWQLRRVDGVQDVVAVFHGELETDEVAETPWASMQFYANQTDVPRLAFLPPHPTLSLHRGHLPSPQSLDEAVLGYELAQALHLRIGDVFTIRQRTLRVAGIWGPSPHLPGNFVQVSAAAAQAMLSGASLSPHHFTVLTEAEPDAAQPPAPAGGGFGDASPPPSSRSGDASQVAARLWHSLPDLAVWSPIWESSRTRHERATLALALAGAVALAMLVSLSPLEGLARGMHIALLSGTGGLAAGWLATLVINRYARDTMGLTPLQVTPRLAAVVLLACAGMGLLATRRALHWPWRARYVATVVALGLCGAMLVLAGTLRESLSLSLAEAQRSAKDRVTIGSVPVDGELLQGVRRLAGVRGYVIEVYGGLVNTDEARWLGPLPLSGVLYGLRSVGGEGTLSMPYGIGYWRGHALNTESLSDAVVGYDLAQEQGLDTGDTIDVRNVAFRVVGIREHLPYDPSSDFNHRVDISLEALRRVLRDPFVYGELTLLIPPAKTEDDKRVFLQEVASRLHVDRMSTIEDKMAEIARSYPAAWTLTQPDPQAAIRHAQAIYSSGSAGCWLVLLAAEALAVMGTMDCRLIEDERRIALLKALGADEGTLLGESLQRATALGMAGAALGLMAGWAASSALNRLAPSRSVELLFTPRLAASVFFFIVLTATLAAVIPAGRAVRQAAASIWRS